MSQHLKVLAGAGLVKSRKEGGRMYLAINPTRLQELKASCSKSAEQPATSRPDTRLVDLSDLPEEADAPA